MPRAAWIVAALICSSVCVDCQDESRPTPPLRGSRKSGSADRFLFASERADYSVSHPRFSDATGIQVDVCDLGRVGETMALAIAPVFVTDAMLGGMEILLRDEQGNLLWRTEWILPLEDTDSSYVIIEQTVEDTLKISRKLSGGVLTEEYDLDGTMGIFSMIPGEDPPDSVASAFLDFWEDGNSLEDNEYGTVAIGISTSEDFYDWIEGSLGTGNRMAKAVRSLRSPMYPRLYELICYVAGGCAIKCWFVPNPLCGPCEGVAVACAVLSLLCLLNPNWCY